jgi:hypothetical protein
LPFQESRVVNRKNTNSLITTPFTQNEVKSFLGIVGRYLLVFIDVAFYKTGSISPCSQMLCKLKITNELTYHRSRYVLFRF